MNRTQGGDTVLYYPDTVLVLDYQVGVPEPGNKEEEFRVLQNYPNPMADQTTISLYVPEKDRVSLSITDIMGRVLIESERRLDKGFHSFRFIACDGSLFFFTAQWQGNSKGIKILCRDMSMQGACALEYLGSEALGTQLKAAVNIQSFPFSIGDTLLYIGYKDTMESGFLDSPETSGSYSFQFATNIPCPGIPTVTYEGQVYNTVQIFSQCWLKENLNVGTRINGNQQQSNNGTIEKYCLSNDLDSCIKYGGLYQWNEMMQYVTIQGAQGICPQGWHIPANEEWKILEGAADSQYTIGSPVWDSTVWCGFDAGLNLKSSWGWINYGNGRDSFGYSAIPAGIRTELGNLLGQRTFTYFWSSTMHTQYAIHKRLFSFDHDNVNHFPIHVDLGYSVRCLKDD